MLNSKALVVKPGQTKRKLRLSCFIKFVGFQGPAMHISFFFRIYTVMDHNMQSWWTQETFRRVSLLLRLVVVFCPSFAACHFLAFFGLLLCLWPSFCIHIFHIAEVLSISFIPPNIEKVWSRSMFVSFWKFGPWDISFRLLPSKVKSKAVYTWDLSHYVVSKKQQIRIQMFTNNSPLEPDYYIQLCKI